VTLEDKGYELFDYTGASKSDKRPYISLQIRGSFQINHAAFVLMGEPNCVRIFYNREKRMVAFQPAKEGERAAYRVRKAPNAFTYSVAAQAFINHYGIDVTETRRYHAAKDDSVVAIDLNAPESKTNRAKKAFKPRLPGM
jgi:hypothetical protein